MEEYAVLLIFYRLAMKKCLASKYFFQLIFFPFRVLIFKGQTNYKSTDEGKDQESIQSSTTPDKLRWSQGYAMLFFLLNWFQSVILL